MKAKEIRYIDVEIDDRELLAEIQGRLFRTFERLKKYDSVYFSKGKLYGYEEDSQGHGRDEEIKSPTKNEIDVVKARDTVRKYWKTK